MNGHYIMSWRVGSGQGVPGIVSHALYRPLERHKHHHGEDHSSIQAEGIESRSCRVSQTHPSGSVVDDGGLSSTGFGPCDRTFRTRNTSQHSIIVITGVDKGLHLLGRFVR